MMFSPKKTNHKVRQSKPLSYGLREICLKSPRVSPNFAKWTTCGQDSILPNILIEVCGIMMYFSLTLFFSMILLIIDLYIFTYWQWQKMNINTIGLWLRRIVFLNGHSCMILTNHNFLIQPTRPYLYGSCHTSYLYSYHNKFFFTQGHTYSLDLIFRKF